MPDRSRRDGTALLVVLGGLPGVGKTAIARELARCLAATHVRIDSIETAIACSGDLTAPVVVAGYEVGYAVAADQLALGHAVVADCVNPIAVTRQAWLDIAARAGALALQAEVVCSDTSTHRARVEGRRSDLPGLTLPTWAQVQARDYEPWAADVRVDTAYLSVQEAADLIVDAVAQARGVGQSAHG